MNKPKRRIKDITDPSSVTMIHHNAATGAQKGMSSVLPVPQAIKTTDAQAYALPAGLQKIGAGKLVWLTAAGYTLTDSTGEYKPVTVSAALAPIGSVVSTGLHWDTITAPGAFIVEDDSDVTRDVYPSSQG